MYYYANENLNELWNGRHKELMREAENRRLARRLRAARREPKLRSRQALATLGFLAALVLVVGLVLASAGPAHATTTFTVNHTSDFPDALLEDTVNVCDADIFQRGEQCTLRAAIQEANNTPGADEIHFDIPEAANPDVKTIQPASQLPDIRETVTIDGYTQPGASPNTLAQGTNAKILIELNGESINAPGGAHGLLIIGEDASASVVRGIAINHFFGLGINIIGSGLGQQGIKIEGNFIGTDPSGTQALGNAMGGVGITTGASDNTVGGTTPGVRNLISGNGQSGVSVSPGSVGASGNEIVGNLIGTQKDGISPLGNTAAGVHIFGGADDNSVGETTAASANTIAFNGRDGVMISSGPDEQSTGNRVLRNSIFSNNGLGIDLIGPGESPLTDVVTPNDAAADADTGPNELQNSPFLSSARTSDRRTTIKGTLNSEPNEAYVVRFFSNFTGADAEGNKIIGQRSVSTDASGNASFSLRVRRVSGLVTATATDSGGNTSEFSAPKSVVRR